MVEYKGIEKVDADALSAQRSLTEALRERAVPPFLILARELVSL